MTEPLAHSRKPHTHPRLHAVRHLVEMLVAMQVGMMVGAGLLAAALGTSVPEARRDHAAAWVLVMAIDMSVPMAAVMLFRGHSRRGAAEMAAAMIVPAVPVLALQLGGASVGHAYMPLSMLAMIALVVYRRREYGLGAAAPAAEVQS